MEERELPPIPWMIAWAFSMQSASTDHADASDRLTVSQKKKKKKIASLFVGAPDQVDVLVICCSCCLQRTRPIRSRERAPKSASTDHALLLIASIFVRSPDQADASVIYTLAVCMAHGRFGEGRGCKQCLTFRFLNIFRTSQKFENFEKFTKFRRNNLNISARFVI